MLKRSILAALATAGVLLAVTPASATPVTVSFTGTIDATSPMFASFGVTGTYVYGTVAPRAGSTSAAADYDETQGFTFFVRNLANTLVYSGSSTGSDIQIGNDGSNPDRYAVVATSLTGLSGSPDPVSFNLGLFFINLLDSTKTTITDALTLDLNPNAHTFTTKEFGFNFDPEFIGCGAEITACNVDLIAIHGTLDSLRIPTTGDPAVPEPATLVLLGTGLAAVARKRRTR